MTWTARVLWTQWPVSVILTMNALLVSYTCVLPGWGLLPFPAAPAHEEGMGGPVPEGTGAPHSQDGAGAPSPADHPASRDQTPAAPTRQDITTKEGAASSIRIPANTLAILGIVFSLCIIIAIVAAVKIHVKRKEEADLLLRRQRRLERLEDIGYSSSEFDRLLAERGSRPRPHAGPEEAGVKNPFSVELAIPIGYNVGGYDVGFICNTYFN